MGVAVKTPKRRVMQVAESRALGQIYHPNRLFPTLRESDLENDVCDKET
jgi:hypothetical protein